MLLPLELGGEGGGGQFDDDEGGGCVGAGGGGDGVAGGGGEAYTGGLHGLSHAAHIVHSTSYFDPAQVFALAFFDNRSCSMMNMLKDVFKGRVDFIVRI